MKPFALLVAVALALTGCAAEPTPAKTITTTVTATPAPVGRSASDALTALDAWLACYSAVRAQYEAGTGPDPSIAWFPYKDTAVTDNGDGSFTATIGFPANGGSAINRCTASGTVGAPTLTLAGFTDI